MRVISERQPLIAAAAFAFIVLNNVTAVVLIFAAYRLDLQALAATASLVDLRPVDGVLFRWGMLIDMLGYLAFVPVAVFLHRRLGAIAPGRREQGWVGVLTFCGVGFALIGAIGAAIFASAGAYLVETATGGWAGPADVTFGALAASVYVGLWGMLELLLYGIWLVGVGWLVRGEGRTFGWTAVIGGVGMLAYSARTMLTGEPPIPFDGWLDILIAVGVGLALLWLLWLAVRLWRGR
ncbi:MAG TPA: hypothetical protein VM344_02750 [Vitreimonas sp.]|nr:hypothetical protein [Vitreimonas sp.]